jgi:hypothetical protein
VADDHTKIHQGDRITKEVAGQAFAEKKGHHFGETIAKGNSVVHQGDIYGWSA